MSEETKPVALCMRSTAPASVKEAWDGFDQFKEERKQKAAFLTKIMKDADEWSSKEHERLWQQMESALVAERITPGDFNPKKDRLTIEDHGVITLHKGQYGKDDPRDNPIIRALKSIKPEDLFQ